VAVVETVRGKSAVCSVVCGYCGREAARYERDNDLDIRAAEFTALIHRSSCGPQEVRVQAVEALYGMGLSLS
jgi:hypothetical protein